MTSSSARWRAVIPSIRRQLLGRPLLGRQETVTDCADAAPGKSAADPGVRRAMIGRTRQNPDGSMNQLNGAPAGSTRWRRLDQFQQGRFRP